MLHTKLIKMTKTLKTNHLKRVISMIYIEVLAVVVIWLSFWSLIPRDEWWFRGANFPRLQILFIGLIALIGMLFWPTEWDVWRELLLAVLIAAIAYQLKMVLPYTLFWKNRLKGQTTSARSYKTDFTDSF